MLIKICGITRADDARAAAEEGASAIGIIFWPGSPRAATLAQAEAVVAAVPTGVMTVGVFVDPTRVELDTVMARVPLASGFLSGKYRPGARFPSHDYRSQKKPEEIDKILTEVERIKATEVPPGVDMATWATAWPLQHPAVLGPQREHVPRQGQVARQ